MRLREAAGGAWLSTMTGAGKALPKITMMAAKVISMMQWKATADMLLMTEEVGLIR